MSVVTMEDLFGELAGEQQRAPERRPTVKPNRAIDEMVAGTEQIDNMLKKRLGYTRSSDVKEIISNCPLKRFRARDIEIFAQHFLESWWDTPLTDHYRTYYLRWLIENSRDKEFTFHIEHYAKPLAIGSGEAKKHISVYGNTEHWGPMKKGFFKIYGNTGLAAFDNMQGGLAVVAGDSEKLLGRRMTGGTIIMYGNCGRNPGRDMEDGEIHVYGDDSVVFGNDPIDEFLVNTQEATGGKIFLHGRNPPVFEQVLPKFMTEVYHCGRLVWKDGGYVK